MRTLKVRLKQLERELYVAQLGCLRQLDNVVRWVLVGADLAFKRLEEWLQLLDGTVVDLMTVLQTNQPVK